MNNREIKRPDRQASIIDLLKTVEETSTDLGRLSGSGIRANDKDYRQTLRKLEKARQNYHRAVRAFGIRPAVEAEGICAGVRGFLKGRDEGRRRGLEKK